MTVIAERFYSRIPALSPASAVALVDRDRPAPAAVRRERRQFYLAVEGELGQLEVSRHRHHRRRHPRCLRRKTSRRVRRGR